MKYNYKSKISDEDCRIIVDHLITNEYRELLISDLVNFHKSVLTADKILDYPREGGAWHAGHYKFIVRFDKGQKYVEKVWQSGKYHKADKHWS